MENINNASSLLNDIVLIIQKIEYGEVIIRIHNSKVVEIEKKERQRYDTRPDNRSF